MIRYASGIDGISFFSKNKTDLYPFSPNTVPPEEYFLQYCAKVFNNMDDKSLIRVELKKNPLSPDGEKSFSGWGKINFQR